MRNPTYTDHVSETYGPITLSGTSLTNVCTLSGATWVGGVRGKAARFDGVNDFAFVEDSAGTLFNVGEKLSVLCRFRVNEDWTVDPKRVLEKLGSPDTDFSKAPFAIETVDTGNQFGFRIATNNGTKIAVTTTDKGPNTWYDVCGIFDGSNVKIFVNGSQEGSNARTGSILTNTENLYFAHRADPTDLSYENCDIDEVRIFDRVITSGERTAFTEGNYQDIDSSGLKYWCKFNEGTGSISYDSNVNVVYNSWMVPSDSRPNGLIKSVELVPGEVKSRGTLTISPSGTEGNFFARAGSLNNRVVNYLFRNGDTNAGVTAGDQIHVPAVLGDEHMTFLALACGQANTISGIKINYY